jgi:hypothetical protein
MFFETPQVTKPSNSIASVVHASFNSLESYLLMSNSYILSMTNIDTQFQCLTTKCDALQESNWNISGEYQSLKSSINQLKAANEKDSITIQDLEHSFMRLMQCVCS